MQFRSRDKALHHMVRALAGYSCDEPDDLRSVIGVARAASKRITSVAPAKLRRSIVRGLLLCRYLQRVGHRSVPWARRVGGGDAMFVEISGDTVQPSCR